MTPEERAVLEAALRVQDVIGGRIKPGDTPVFERLYEGIQAYRQSLVPNKRYRVREWDEQTWHIVESAYTVVAKAFSQELAERICRLLNEEEP